MSILVYILLVYFIGVTGTLIVFGVIDLLDEANSKQYRNLVSAVCLGCLLWPIEWLSILIQLPVYFKKKRSRITE